MSATVEYFSLKLKYVIQPPHVKVPGRKGKTEFQSLLNFAKENDIAHVGHRKTLQKGLPEDRDQAPF